jgi:hypothetical protein
MSRSEDYNFKPCEHHAGFADSLEEHFYYQKCISSNRLDLLPARPQQREGGAPPFSSRKKVEERIRVCSENSVYEILR